MLNDADIVVDIAGTLETDSSGNNDACEPKPLLPCTAAKLVLAFSVIRLCCGAIEGTELSYTNKIESSVMHFLTQNKR